MVRKLPFDGYELSLLALGRMLATGSFHTVLLKSDGSAVGCGYNFHLWNIPALDGGLSYTQVSAGASHTVLLRSDGSAVAYGDQGLTAGEMPTLHRGLTYTQVAAGGWHTVLLRSDGTAVACCHRIGVQYSLPTLPVGLTYTYVAAGVISTVLLRSDGAVLVHDSRSAGHVLVPSDRRPTCTRAAAGDLHIILLRKDGTVAALGFTSLPYGCDHRIRDGQCDIPALEGRLNYTQVAAGAHHTVLLRSDGAAVACGDNSAGQCDIPALGAGLSYTDVFAGRKHTVLLRSDGTAVACGDNGSRQCDLPSLDGGLSFGLPTLVLQASFDGASVVFKSCGGGELFQLTAAVTDSLADMRVVLAARMGPLCTRIDAIFPGGEVLSKLLREEPLAVLGLLWTPLPEPRRTRRRRT